MRLLTLIANCTIYFIFKFTCPNDSNVRPCSILRYFEGGVSSVYLWDLEDGGFAGVVLMKKSMLMRSVSGLS